MNDSHVNPSALSTALSSALPADQRGGAQDLAELLAAIAQGSLAPEQAATQIAANADLSRLVRSLAGKQVPSDGALVSFGSGNQLGDVTIGDVVGGSQIKLTVNLGDAGPGRRRFLMLGGGLALIAALVVVVIVAIRSSGATQLQQTNQAIAADVLTNITNADQQLGFVATTMSIMVKPEAATSQRVLIGTAQIAELRQSLAMRPLHPAMGATFVQNLIASRADPTAVQNFYAIVQVTQSYCDELLTTLGQLVKQKPDQPQAISYYAQLADLDRRRLENSAAVMHLSGLMVLHSLSYDPASANTQLGQLQHLEPRTLIAEEAINPQLQALVDSAQKLIDERRGLLEQSQQLLVEALQINPGDTWDQVVGKAISLRKRGETDAAVAAFAQYGKMFSASDPTAAQYATTAQAFTRQSIALGVEAGQYIYNVYPNSRSQLAGLQVGDIVIALGQTTVADSDSYTVALKALPADKPCAATILRLGRDGTLTRMVIPLDAPPVDVDTMPI
ncbi:MAG: PDZ domain-containing protein [Chloroflexales bacterium]